MTFLARLLSLFPATVILLILFSLKKIIQAPTLLNFSLLVFSCYLYPLLSFRIHNIFFPLKEGAFDLAERKHSPWWGSYKIQQIYYQLPWLESLLQVIPGLYSFWLRLWGSQVGKGVLWTPNVEINDRGLMVIGDNSVIGHKAHFLCHVINPKEGRVLLIVKKIKLGSNAFIGAASRLGPGVIVDDNVSLPILTIGLPRQHFKKELNKGNSL